MGRVKERYNRRAAEQRFHPVYQPVAGDRCIYCGMPSHGKLDHQPPVYVLHRFADGGLITKKAIRERFGECKLVPCCTICNMGLGAFHGRDDNERRREIANWFLVDDRYPEDHFVMELGRQLLEKRLQGKRGGEIYEFPGVGRVIYLNALFGFIDGDFNCPEEFPTWLQIAQTELSEWLGAEPKRKSKYFLDMANLASYDLVVNRRAKLTPDRRPILTPLL
ncbi:hypothetical protein KEU06_19540 [Pseudaminobacter sp. 19-2017]|uniref:Uncharacterized protein n=1 Tax=Pseudaminobacter soli (ex Zhang et al. 2022) TaxID=2831468 RepID=A0A942I428_9HYPH|nr:hypothetical protein [Pseudaminobacter soli]MBS3650809.1 hypothetical protein [Pseudaminobacter soli]